VLLTSPGERVNRPQFGSGLLDLVFAPATPEVMAAARMRTQGALQQELDQTVQIRAVDIATVDNVLTVAVAYVVRATGVDASARFVVEIPK
jgi:phage baseplate assembly protein W